MKENHASGEKTCEQLPARRVGCSDWFGLFSPQTSNELKLSIERLRLRLQDAQNKKSHFRDQVAMYLPLTGDLAWLWFLNVRRSVKRSAILRFLEMRLRWARRCERGRSVSCVESKLPNAEISGADEPKTPDTK